MQMNIIDFSKLNISITDYTSYKMNVDASWAKNPQKMIYICFYLAIFFSDAS